MRIISRAEWGARAPRSITRTTWAKRIGVAVHYSQGNPNNTPRDLQNYAMNTLGYVDTHYNFFVNRNGEIFEGRGWLVVAAHAANQNTPWIGVCFIGQDGDVTDAAKTAIRWLYDEACRLSGRTLQYSGHGQLPGQNTSCPGENLKAWVAQGMPYPYGNGDDDMFCAYGDKGPKVRAMQLQLLQLDPACLPRFGADSGYGEETRVALSRLVTGGDAEVYGPDGWALMQQLVSAKFGKGEKGDRGLEGPPGKTPTKVRLADAVLDVVEVTDSVPVS